MARPPQGVLATVELVHFELSETFQPAATDIVRQVAVLVQSEVRDAAVEDMGATAIPGLVTKGDVDVNARVGTADFSRLVEFLRLHFDVHQPQNWADGFASFVDHTTYLLPVGVHVTIVGHPQDTFVAQRDRLAARADLIAKYNRLKIRHQDAPMKGYRTAKWVFIKEHLA